MLRKKQIQKKLQPYLDFSSIPWKTGLLEPKIKELIYIAIDIATTHFFLSGTRIHIRNAIRHGAIKEEIIAGAAIDVLATEPPANNHPYLQLLSRPNFILTPHIAWASTEAMQTLSDQMIENIENFVEEKPSNIVS